TATLTISNLLLAQNNYSFRCIVSESNCTSISNSALLNVYDFTGIEALSAENSFIVYLNPTKDFIIITTKKMISDPYILYDIAGKKVLAGKLEDRETKIDLKSIHNGLYVISIGSEKPIKLVKQ